MWHMERASASELSSLTLSGGMSILITLKTISFTCLFSALPYPVRAIFNSVELYSKTGIEFWAARSIIMPRAEPRVSDERILL